MATYLELMGLFGHNDLLVKTEVACIIAAESIRSEDPGTTNHANRLIWAKKAFENPRAIRNQMLMAMLAANSDLDVSVITGATDAQIQAKVDAAIDVFADGS